VCAEPARTHTSSCARLQILLQVAGAFVVGVGLLVTIPVAVIAFCFCYHHIAGVNGISVPYGSASEAAPQAAELVEGTALLTEESPA
jgi:hypothetical protein